ncbi:hypothetical protein BG55_04250 [Erwinia mallotivora]|uniref:Uncharacterized protein n=1 Tax=Erwinia mallotivora TaxID=69222 RepID=A0A014NBE2_9GAMM|nr:hypothetical protein BG55_04250 [Erwinia mallotivora]
MNDGLNSITAGAAAALASEESKVSALPTGATTTQTTLIVVMIFLDEIAHSGVIFALLSKFIFD